MMKLSKRSRTNPFRPQSVNPRQGTVSSRISSFQQPRPNWLARHKLFVSLLIAVIIMLIMTGTAYYISYKWLIIEQIQVNQPVIVQPTIVTPDQVQQKLKSYQHKSLLLLDQQQLEKQILADFAGMSEIYVTRQYPHTLIVDYIPNIALAQLDSPTSSFLVNRQGKIFAEAKADRLPHIITPDRNIAVGQTISAQGLSLALGLIEGLRQTTPAIKTITLSDRQLELILHSNPRILIGQHQSPTQTVRIIQDLLRQFEEQQKTPQLLDLRFDRPILQY